MKKLMSIFAVLLGLALPVKADSLQEINENKQGAKAYWVSADVSSTTASKAVLLYYVGTATESLVAISGSSVTAYAPQGTADSSFGTSGVYNIDAPAYDSLGELCDAIDALSSYGCLMLGAKRNDPSKLLLDQSAVTGTNDLKAVGGFEVGFSSGPIPPNSDSANGANFLRVGVTPTSGHRVLLKKCEWFSVDAGSIAVYGKRVDQEYSLAYQKDRGFVPSKPDDTQAVWADDVAAVTGETQDFTSAGGGGQDGYEFARDAHVVVSVNSSAPTVAQTPGARLRCLVEIR